MTTTPLTARRALEAVTLRPGPLRNGDRVLILCGGYDGDYAHVVFVRPDGRYDLLTESWVNLYAYPAKILWKVG